MLTMLASSALILLLLSVSLINNTTPAYSQADPDNNKNPATRKQFFGCGMLLELIHCQPLYNKTVGHLNGISVKIYYPSELALEIAESSKLITVEPRAISQSNVPNEEWQFIAVTWDGTILKFYRNGILEGNSTRQGSLTTPVLAQIGSGEETHTSGNYWKGAIDEVRIYDRALPEKEIHELFDGSNDVLDGIVGHWKFDGKTNDTSGNGNHGIYQGNKTQFVEGKHGNALHFDGDDHVDLPSLPEFSEALSFTAWVKLDRATLDNSREIFNNNQLIVRVDPQSEAENRLSAFVKLIQYSDDFFANRPIIASMAFAPDGRLFFTEKNTGTVGIMKDDKVLETPFVKISNIYTVNESGLLGLTLDPDFEENHFVYIYYTYKDSITEQIFNRLARFTDDNNVGTEMRILLDRIPASDAGTHSGGALEFGPDEKLYITVGDTLRPESTQDPSILAGKILRINRDGTIPDDNPWFWDNNSSKIYNNEVLDENLICEFGVKQSFDLRICNFHVWNPGNSSFVVQRDFETKVVNQTSIKITVNNKSNAVVLSRDYVRFHGGFIQEKGRDWSEYKYLTLWMKGSNENSTMGVKITDSSWDYRYEQYLIRNNFTGWEFFTIPLGDSFPTTNLSSVRGIGFEFHTGWNSTINLDAVYLSNSVDPFAERRNYTHVSPVYTVGHRNMFGIAFNNEGVGIVTENGLDYYDEINRIERAGNYGYPIYQPPDRAPELSVHSIKPITSYENIIAPVQAIYYDGNGIPELKGKFLFASFLTGSIYALEVERDTEKLMYEEIVKPNSTEPIASLAQSPDGSLYYGGFAVYRLENVYRNYKQDVLFPIEITGAVNVKDLQLHEDEKKMALNMSAQDSLSYVSLKIPTVLLDRILAATDGTHKLDFTVNDASEGYNIVNLQLAKGDYQIILEGTSMNPKFPIYLIVVIVVMLFALAVGVILFRKKLVVNLTKKS